MSQTAEILTPFGTYRTPEGNAEVVKTLEEFLEMAHKGEIICIAMAALKPNDNSITSWRVGSQSSFTVLGLIEVLKDDILTCNRTL